MRSHTFRSHPNRLIALLLAVLVAATTIFHVVTAPEAQAAARVTISGHNGGQTLPAGQQSSIQLRGTGFQNIRNGFGGIYVLFGWVDNPGGNWAPSKGGRTGRNYAYVPDTEDKNNQGYSRFVTFPGSSTANTAHATMGNDGSWSVNMNIPGARFFTQDRQGNRKEIDCTKVTCGVITIGAHGVSNSSNETFTPVKFVGSAGATADIRVDNSAAEANRGAAQAQGGGRGGQDVTLANPQQAQVDALAQEGNQEADSSTTEQAEDSEKILVDGVLTLGLEQETVQIGRVLGFTGQGFNPGEQVVATLSSGATGAGPVVAGEHGEVAGAVPIPEDILPGTHILKLTGGASGLTVQAEFIAVKDPLAATDEQHSGWTWGLITVIIVGALILIFIITSVIVAQVRKVKAKKAAEEAENEKAWAEYEAYYGAEAAERANEELKRRRSKGRRGKRSQDNGSDDTQQLIVAQKVDA